MATSIQKMFSGCNTLSSIKYNTGNPWQTKPAEVGVKELTAEYLEVRESVGGSYFGSLDVELMIKEKLADELAHELLKNDYIHFNKEYDAYQLSNKYRASLIIADQGTTGVIINKDVYTVSDMEFTHEQIKEAIKFTYPELFL